MNCIGGGAARSGKREFHTRVALALSSFAFLLFAAPAWAQDLSISNDDNPNPVAEGDLLMYTITINNDGPDDATGVRVIDKLPSGVRFLGADPSMGKCTEADDVVTCALGDIPKGQDEEIALFVQPTVTGTLEHSARVTSESADPKRDNNEVRINTKVNRERDRRISRRDDRRFPSFFPPFLPNGSFNPDPNGNGGIDTTDGDVNGDGNVDQEDQAIDAENDLSDEGTDGEDTNGDETGSTTTTGTTAA